MAKPSKSHQFEIYEDEDQPSGEMEHIPEPGDLPHSLPGEPRATFLRTDSAYSQQKRDGGGNPGDLQSQESEADEDGDTTLLHEVDHELDDADDERRESVFTSASVSSLPESAFETDYERGAMHKPYTPPMIRPSFRRPESVRRMQMSSPAPSERSLRRSVLSPPRSRTSRSARSSVKGSPRPQKWADEEPQQDKKDYPLVLLHLTLLPANLHWSRQSMEELLPADTLESLQLLKSKISSTIHQRGILIPHPKDEYELLEERLLEALELKKERVTRCGHFRARESTSSASSADSGVGSSVEGLDYGDSCATCHHELKTVNSAVRAGGRKWSIKVFAANGLMRASAWTAAWADMESIDVEILPWIDEEVRKALDTRALQEAAEDFARHEEEARNMAEAEEVFRVEEARAWEASKGRNDQRDHNTQAEHIAPISHNAKPSTRGVDDLPQVYRPKDIPLSLLLKNYVFLLAQDKRNVIIFGLAMLTLFVSLRASLGPDTNLALPPVCKDIQAESPVLQHMAKDVLSSSPEPVASSAIEQIENFLENTTTAVDEFEIPSPNDAEHLVQIASEVTKVEDSPELFRNEAVTGNETPVIEKPGANLEQCRNPASVISLFAVMEQTKV